MLFRRAAVSVLAVALAAVATPAASAERPDRRGPATVTFTGTG